MVWSDLGRDNRCGTELGKSSNLKLGGDSAGNGEEFAEFEKLGGAGGIRTHEWRFCRALVLLWLISFQQVRNVLAGLLWDVWACLGVIVQKIVQGHERVAQL